MEQINRETCFGVNQNDPVQLEKAGQLFHYDPGNLKHVWSMTPIGTTALQHCRINAHKLD
jgi:hypothetical protein